MAQAEAEAAAARPKLKNEDSLGMHTDGGKQTGNWKRQAREARERARQYKRQLEQIQAGPQERSPSPSQDAPRDAASSSGAAAVMAADGAPAVVEPGLAETAETAETEPAEQAADSAPAEETAPTTAAEADAPAEKVPVAAQGAAVAEEDVSAYALDSSECVVCLDKMRTHAFLECMHLCVCGGCAEELLDKDQWRNTVHAEGAECPLCRTKSIKIRRVFN